MSTLRAYLDRLGIDGTPPPTLATLREVHRRHVGRVPYENLGIMLGRPPSVQPDECLARVGDVGRAGYCFHQNGALESALRQLGFAVERRHGHVWFRDENRYDRELTHLVLVVTGLPDDDNPPGLWWADVGLGDAFVEPLPLVAGEHVEGGFRYRMESVTPEAWTFFHDPAAHSFTGIEITSDPVGAGPVGAAHAQLSTPPEGPFTRILVAQRRDPDGIDSLRGCRLVRITPDGQDETILTTYDAWRGALVDVLGVHLGDVADDELRALFGRTWQAHQEWEAAGRP